MTISELKSMNRREFALWFAHAKTEDLKEVLKNENLGGGISKFKKADLENVILDLIDGIVSELTKKLKSNPKPRKTKIKKQLAKEEQWYKELLDTPKALRLTSMTSKNIDEASHWLYFSVTVYGNGNGIDGFVETENELKKKYRQMVKYFHPDNKETGNSEKFKIIQEAWEVAKEENKNDLEYMKKTKDMTMEEKFNDLFN